jgi:fermentation-respiration switch protein FrsA (DUF1100 family)
MNFRPKFLAALLAVTLGSLAPLAGQGGFDALAAAGDFILRFVAKDPGLDSSFDATMKKAYTTAQAAAVADQLLARGGTWKGLGPANLESKGGYSVVSIRGNYERIAVDFSVSFDGQERIAGFFITKMESTLAWSLPAYARAGSYVEEEAVVDAGGWPLPATLSIPKGRGPFPALIFVHGSGPNDRDESIGPNRVFGDLSSGLATGGIATLRYEKRTKRYAERLAGIVETLGTDEETVDDAIAALALLAKDPRVDRGRIFLVGHSLGAMLGPRIAQRAAAKGIPLVGIILLAPNARPLEDIILDQVTYLAKLGSAPGDPASLAELRAAVGRVKALPAKPTATDPRAAELPLGIPAAWWRSLAGYDPVRVAASLGLPLLVIHGSRDYQVMPGEAELWKKGLSGLSKAKTLLLPGLNHLMMGGSGVPAPAEYDVQSHVDEAVIKVIISFVGSVMAEKPKP